MPGGRYPDFLGRVFQLHAGEANTAESLDRLSSSCPAASLHIPATMYTTNNNELVYCVEIPMRIAKKRYRICRIAKDVVDVGVRRKRGMIDVTALRIADLVSRKQPPGTALHRLALVVRSSFFELRKKLNKLRRNNPQTQRP